MNNLGFQASVNPPVFTCRTQTPEAAESFVQCFCFYFIGDLISSASYAVTSSYLKKVYEMQNTRKLFAFHLPARWQAHGGLNINAIIEEKRFLFTHHRLWRAFEYFKINELQFSERAFLFIAVKDLYRAQVSDFVSLDSNVRNQWS